MALSKVPNNQAMGVLRALLHVCRADGVINQDELRALRRCAEEMGVTDVDEEMLLLEDEMRPDALGRLLRGTSAQFCAAVIDSAKALSIVDGDLDDAEERAIEEYARALGVKTGERPGSAGERQPAAPPTKVASVVLASATWVSGQPCEASAISTKRASGMPAASARPSGGGAMGSQAALTTSTGRPPSDDNRDEQSNRRMARSCALDTAG